jgi:hypothetical protein
MIDRFKRAWAAFWDEPAQNFKVNQQMRVFTDQGREWLDINLAPHGVRLHLLTTGCTATHGSVSDRTKFQFIGWEPLPSTPQWMKEEAIKR